MHAGNLRVQAKTGLRPRAAIGGFRLRAFGFEFDRQRGSHAVYLHPKTGDRFVFPVRRPHLLVVYVRQAVKLLKQRLEEEEGE